MDMSIFKEQKMNPVIQKYKKPKNHEKTKYLL